MPAKWQFLGLLLWKQKGGRWVKIFIFCIKTLWNSTGLLLTIGRYVSNIFFQNGCHCHGNRGKKRFKFYQNLLCRYFLNLMEMNNGIGLCKKSPSYWQLVQLLLWKQKKGGGDLNNFNMYSMQWFRQMFYLTDTSSSHLVSFGRLLWSLDHRVLIF